MTSVSTANKINDYSDIWLKIKNEIIEETPNAKFWLSSINLKLISTNTVILTSSTTFTKDWIQSHYIEDILRKWQLIIDSIKIIEIIIENITTPTQEEIKTEMFIDSSQTDDDREKKSIDLNNNKSLDFNNKIQSIDLRATKTDNFSSAFDRRFTFESFVVAKSNEFAFNAIRAVAESDIPLPNSNPLFLRGDVGLGKTHLMHAAGQYIKQNNNKRNVIYLSAEKFMYQFITALRNKDVFSFKEYFRSADVLMVDDVQFIGGKENTQEEFFHTFNELINDNKQLIFSANRPPCELKGIEERIKSRLNCGLVVDVNATTYELRLGILQAKIKNIDINLSRDILEYLAEKIISNVRELEGALNRIIAYSKYNNKPTIDIITVNSILSDMLHNSHKNITLDDIKQKVADHFDISITAICGKTRTHNLAFPRQIAMYLSKQLTTKSFPEIGRAFGGRDHATVIHACRKISKLFQENNKISQTIEDITNKIKNY